MLLKRNFCQGLYYRHALTACRAMQLRFFFESGNIIKQFLLCKGSYQPENLWLIVQRLNNTTDWIYS